MPEHAPHQIFDGSFFESIAQTPALKTAPPDVETALENAEIELPDFQTFDWDAYNREFFERIPDSAKKTDRGREMAQVAGTQIWMARQFPPPVLAFLIEKASAKSVWTYLSADDRKALMKDATRGFQRTPAIVRQPVVRARLVQWLQKNPDEIYIILMIWALGTPPPPIILLAQNEIDGVRIRERLLGWVKKYGIEGTIAGLAIAAKPRTMATLIEWLKNPQEMVRMVMEAPDDLGEHAAEISSAELESALEAAPEALLNFPDSDSARYWKAECDAAQKRDQARSDMLGKMLDANENFMAVITRQKGELEAAQKREKLLQSGLEKKLGATQKRAQTQLEELQKAHERQGRKLRALEREHESLDLENRRFKKQLRRAGTLLEEERRNIAALEAKILQSAAPVEALSTPKSAQTAPGKVVVVQAPTPLDEIFEWRADGRPVRITARAVRRLIDRNDEEGVFAVVQALDSLQRTDKSLHGKFWKRIGDTSPYHARVLRENMARVLVDASNVARYKPNKYGKGQFRHLIGMRDELRRLGCFPIIFIADASLRHMIDDTAKFQEMVASGEIEVVDKGIEADEILAREARRTGAYVVTNDAKFFHKVSPDFEPPRVTFRIYDGTVIVDEF